MALTLGACPAGTAEVQRPEGASTCTSDADCNPGVAPLCGAIKACVDERCERIPSRTVHCP